MLWKGNTNKTIATATKRYGIMNIYETFDNLRYQYENEVVEFKKAEHSFDFDDLGKYFSALSNEANLRDKGFAWLVFGVHDKTREIIGTSFKNGIKSLQKLKQDLSQHTTDNNTFREIFEMEVEGKRVLIFQIPAAPRGNENYSLMLLANQDMSLTDAVLLDQVQKGNPINDNAIKKLRKEGLIEGRKPHLYVSKQVAKATNTQVEYTLKKGFNDAECQEWIIKALKDHKVLSRKQINELLWNKLPVDFTDTQRINKIGNLIMKLKRQGIIKTDEKRLWHLA